MADMTTIKGRIAETIYPNGQGAITAESHQALLLEMVDDINTKKADQSELIATQESLDALEQKVDNLPQGGGDFDAEGNYPLLHVGTADDLAGRGESVPAEFGFRASGGKSIKDGRAYIKRIKGNSLVWNQLYPTGWSVIREGITVTSQNNIITANGTLTNTYFGNAQFVGNEVNHKYLLIVEGLSSAFNGANFSLQNRPSSGAIISNGFAYFFYDNSDPSLGRNIGFSRLTSGAVISETYILRQIDLTKMFEAGYEPTTIEEFYARVATLGVDMNAYNEGQVIHCNTESIKSVGDNAWDEEWRNGIYSSIHGLVNTNQKDFVCNLNPIRVLPNAEYSIEIPTKEGYAFFYDENMQYLGYKGTLPTIKTPSNAYYMNFYAGRSYGATYNHDIMITLVHSGWKQDTDAGYQPYWQDILPLSIIRKYFPQGMKSAGTAHDEIRYNKASGKWEYSKSKTGGGKIKSVDLGSLGWYKDSTKDFFKVDIDEVIGTNYLCAKYIPITYQQLGVDMGINCVDLGGGKSQVRISDTSYTDAATFKADMAGVMLYYESNDWEWVELDAEDQNFRDYYNVADFGTEQSQSSVPSAPFSADIIYQFNAVDMIREHELEITELQNIIATMQAQLTSLINGGQ